MPSLSESLSQKCRICLRKGVVPVFDNENDNNSDLPLSLYLKIVCDIEITAHDTYPQRLCKSCHFTLDKTIKLRETAKRTQLTLEKLYSLKEIDMKIQTKVKGTIEVSGTAKKTTLQSKEKDVTRTAPVKTKSKVIEIKYVDVPIHTTPSKFDEISNNNQAKKSQQIIIPIRVTAGKYDVKQEEVNPIGTDISQEAQKKSEETCPISSLSKLKSENLRVTQQGKEINLVNKNNPIDEVKNLELEQQKNYKIGHVSPDIKKICTKTTPPAKITTEKEKNNRRECTSPDMEHLGMEEYLNLEDLNDTDSHVYQDEEMDLGSNEEWYHNKVENDELLPHDETVKFNNTSSDNKHPEITDSFKSADESESKNDQQMVIGSDEEWLEDTTTDVNLKDKSKENQEISKRDSLDSESDEDYFDRPNKNHDGEKKVLEFRKKIPPLKNKYFKKVFLLDNKQRFQCQICKKILVQSTNQHVLSHLPDYPPQYLCEVCGKTFQSRTPFNQHKFRHSKSLPFKCDQCPYRGSSKELLRSHLRMHIQEHQYLCSQCPRKFTGKQHLLRHIRLHSDPKLKCTSCNKLFREKYQLALHVKSMHAPVEPVSCDICGNVYKTRKSLLRHETKVHNRKKKNPRAMYLRLDRDLES